MAMAFVVTNFAYLFKDMGTAAAIIQADQIANEVVNTIHWTNVGLGVLIGISIAIVAPLISIIFHEPDLTFLLCILALVFPISSFGATRQALFERDSKFSIVVKTEIAGTIVGLLVALMFAWFGAGALSLVIQMLTGIIISMVMLAMASPYRPILRWRWSEFLSVLNFSGNLFLFNFINYFSRNVDSMIIGRLLGASPLGIYTMAYRLMLFPVQNMTAVASRALYPVMSRNQGSIEEVARLYLKSIGFIAFLTAPVMAGLFVLREPFVQVVFGEKWHAVAGILAWLAPVGFIQSIVSTAGTIFMARGRTDLLFRIGVMSAIVLVSAILIGSHWGIEGVAACYLAANIIIAIPVLFLSGKLIDVGLRAIYEAIRVPIALSMTMWLAVTFMEMVLKHAGWLLFARFSTLVLVGAIAYGTGSYLLNAAQLKNVLLFFGRRT